MCVCVVASVCVSRERSCQAELWGCSSIQPSNNNEPLTMLDRAHRLSSPVAIAVVIVCKSLDACVVWVHIYIYVHLCSTSLCLTGSVFCHNLNSCCWCWQPVLSIVVQWAIAEADSGQVGLSCCWTHISPPCDSLFRNAPAHLSPLAAPVKSWFAHRHGQRHINSTPCRLARGERRRTQTNQTQRWYEREREQKRGSRERWH